MVDRLHIFHWFEFASDDLDSAKILAKHGLRKANAVRCHSRQSAEKNLKGCLLANGLEELPHTHNLPGLIVLCANIDASFAKIKAPCIRLSPYSARAKHPDEIEVDRHNAAQAISGAETVASFAPIMKIRTELEAEYRKEYAVSETTQTAAAEDEPKTR